MDIRETRTRRLLGLLRTERFGGVVAELARAAGKSETQVRANLYPEKTGGRTIGEKLARSYESALGLPAGWLDIEEGKPQLTEANQELLAEIERMPPEMQAHWLALMRQMNKGAPGSD